MGEGSCVGVEGTIGGRGRKRWIGRRLIGFAYLIIINNLDRVFQISTLLTLLTLLTLHRVGGNIQFGGRRGNGRR